MAVLMPIARPSRVGQRTAGVAGVDRSVGLDQVVQLAHRGGDRAAECAHDAGGHRLAQAERAPDGDRHLADLHIGEGAEGERLQIGRGALIGPDDGGVDGLVDRDHGAGDARAVVEPERDRVRSTDDVRCGEDEAPVGRHEPGADRAVGLDLHDRGQEPRGRVGERLIARRDHRGRLVRPARATGGERAAARQAGCRWRAIPVPTRTMAPTRTAVPTTSRRRGRLEAPAAGIGDAAAPTAAVANAGAAVGQTRGGVGGRSRQLLC